MTGREQKSLGKLYAKAVALWAPPENLTVDEWSDKYRILEDGLSAEPGPWRTSRTPYIREPMRAFTDPDIEEITVVAPSQVGKSELELNIIGYIIDQDPGTILYVHPRKEDAEAFSKQRVSPMFKACPRLHKKIKGADKRGRNASSTVMIKSFPGGSLRMVGTNSASDLSSLPVRYVIGDELDRFAKSTGRDGDPWELAKRRQNTFYNRKRVAVSTPTVAGESQIEFLYKRGTCERWKTQCPECGEYHEIRFDDVRFTSKMERIAGKDTWTVDVSGWKCPGCRQIIPEKAAKKAPAKWVAENPDAIKNNRSRSFWINGFASPWRPWADILKIFCESKHDPEKLVVWKNTDVGELWENRKVTTTEDELIARAEEYPEGADLPGEPGEGPLVLTCGIDWQHKYCRYEIVGWTRYNESWGIQSGFIHGAPDDDKVWEGIDSIISRVYRFANGRGLRVVATFIDSSDGNYTSIIAEKCRVRAALGVYAVKGSSKFDKPFLSPPNYIPVAATKNEKYWLYSVGVSAGKFNIMRYVERQTPGPGYMHFPKDGNRGYDFNYYRELLSETQITEGNKVVWKKLPGHDRNEALDCRNYAMAAASSFKFDFDRVERELKRPLQENKPKKQPKTRRRSRRDEFFE